MKNVRIKRIIGALLAVLACMLLVTACGEKESQKSSIEAYTPSESDTFLYLYGVVKDDGQYYAKVLTERKDEPKEEDYKYVPLANDINASFQPEGWVGAWCPEDYDTAKALSKAYSDEKITPGAKFSYAITDGYMDTLKEDNYYLDNDVTGAK